MDLIKFLLILNCIVQISGFLESFEICTSKDAYALGPTTCSSGVWSLNDALLGSQSLLLFVDFYVVYLAIAFVWIDR